MRPEALLIVGPTGVGKTPLGDLLEAEGLDGRTCVHFDFGACLRAAASGDAGIASVLREGRLLTDAEWPIAERIFARFVARRVDAARPLVVLNGLPRHLGQARDVARLVDVRTVVWLRASLEVVERRIRADAGGDRPGREDDAPEEVRIRYARFETETLPLVDNYRGAGARVVPLAVGPGTRPEALIPRVGR